MGKPLNMFFLGGFVSWGPAQYQLFPVDLFWNHKDGAKESLFPGGIPISMYAGTLFSLFFLTGGLTAVIYTDALQTLIMILGALVLMFIGKGNLQWHHTVV